MRRFTLRALTGAATGTVLGMLAMLLLPPAQAEGGFLTGLGFVGLHWLWPLVLPPAAAIVAFWATRQAARRRLEAMP